jgi:hypothetical protein
MKANLTEVLLDLENAGENVRALQSEGVERQVQVLRDTSKVLIASMRSIIEHVQEIERWT